MIRGRARYFRSTEIWLHSFSLGKCSEPFIRELAGHIGEPFAFPNWLLLNNSSQATFSDLRLFLSVLPVEYFYLGRRDQEDVIDKVRHDMD